MKKTILALMLLASTFIASAHNIERLCWNNGTYGFRATQIPNGSAVIKVYSNSNYTGLIQTINVNVTGGTLVYWVNQPVRTTKVYVKATWHDGYVNQDASGTVQCSTTPILFGPIGAQNVENTTVVTFQVESTDETNQVTITYNMPDGSVKKFPITFLDKLILGDIWAITINNKTGAYTITKKINKHEKVSNYSTGFYIRIYWLYQG